MTTRWCYVDLGHGWTNIEGDIVGLRVKMRGGNHEGGVVVSVDGDNVRLKLDGIDEPYLCSRLNFTIDEERR